MRKSLPFWLKQQNLFAWDFLTVVWRSNSCNGDTVLYLWTFYIYYTKKTSIFLRFKEISIVHVLLNYLVCGSVRFFPLVWKCTSESVFARLCVMPSSSKACSLECDVWIASFRWKNGAYFINVNNTIVHFAFKRIYAEFTF